MSHLEHSWDGNPGLLPHNPPPATPSGTVPRVSLKPHQLHPLIDYLRPLSSIRTHSGWAGKRPPHILPSRGKSGW